MAVPLALLAAPAIMQALAGGYQMFQGAKMQKELGARENYQIPEEAKRALALMQNLASSREMPGQAGMQAMMDYQAQKALGTFSRGATSSTDLAALSADVAGRQFESQLGLGVQAAQNYQQRQQALYGALQNMAGYQEKVTADKQKDWYERAEAAAQMKEGGLQNLMGAAQGAAQIGMAKMAYGNTGTGTTRKQTLSNLDKMNALSSVEDIGLEDPAGYTAPVMSDVAMLGVTGMNNTGGFNYQTPFVQAPQLQSNYGNLTGELPGNQVSTGSNPYQQGAWGQTPQSVIDLMKLLGTSGIIFK